MRVSGQPQSLQEGQLLTAHSTLSWVEKSWERKSSSLLTSFQRQNSGSREEQTEEEGGSMEQGGGEKIMELAGSGLCNGNICRIRAWRAVLGSSGPASPCLPPLCRWCLLGCDLPKVPHGGSAVVAVGWTLTGHTGEDTSWCNTSFL